MVASHKSSPQNYENWRWHWRGRMMVDTIITWWWGWTRPMFWWWKWGPWAGIEHDTHLCCELPLSILGSTQVLGQLFIFHSALKEQVRGYSSPFPNYLKASTLHHPALVSIDARFPEWEFFLSLSKNSSFEFLLFCFYWAIPSNALDYSWHCM